MPASDGQPNRQIWHRFGAPASQGHPQLEKGAALNLLRMLHTEKSKKEALFISAPVYMSCYPVSIRNYTWRETIVFLGFTVL